MWFTQTWSSDSRTLFLMGRELEDGAGSGHKHRVDELVQVTPLPEYNVYQLFPPTP
jgi:hypothetical protein